MNTKSASKKSSLFDDSGEESDGSDDPLRRGSTAASVWR